MFKILQLMHYKLLAIPTAQYLHNHIDDDNNNYADVVNRSLVMTHLMEESIAFTLLANQNIILTLSIANHMLLVLVQYVNLILFL